jgi:hypothetical protein
MVPRWRQLFNGNGKHFGLSSIRTLSDLLVILHRTLLRIHTPIQNEKASSPASLLKEAKKAIPLKSLPEATLLIQAKMQRRLCLPETLLAIVLLIRIVVPLLPLKRIRSRGNLLY